MGKQRECTRSSVEAEVDVVVAGRELHGARITNISLKGLFITCASPPPAGARCTVVAHLGGRGMGVQIKAAGTVVRRDDHGIGVEIDEVVGSEGLHHLRQLVLLNSPNPERAEQEFDDHLGLKSTAE